MSANEPDPVPWTGPSFSSFVMENEDAVAHAYYSEDAPASDDAEAQALAKRRRRTVAALVSLAVVSASSTGVWAYDRHALAAEYDDVWGQYEQVAADHSTALTDATTIAEQCRVATEDEKTCDNLDRAIADAQNAFPSLPKQEKASREAIDAAQSAISAGRDAIGRLSEATGSIEATIRNGVAQELRMALVKARAARTEISDILDFPTDEFAEEETLGSYIGLVARLDSHIAQASEMLEGGSEIGLVEEPGSETDADSDDESATAEETDSTDETDAEETAQEDAEREDDSDREWIYEQAVAAEEENPGAAMLIEGVHLAEAKDLTVVLLDMAEEVRESQWPVRLAHDTFLGRNESVARPQASTSTSARTNRSAETDYGRRAGQNQYGVGQNQNGTGRTQYETGPSLDGAGQAQNEEEYDESQNVADVGQGAAQNDIPVQNDAPVQDDAAVVGESNDNGANAAADPGSDAAANVEQP